MRDRPSRDAPGPSLLPDPPPLRAFAVGASVTINLAAERNLMEAMTLSFIDSVCARLVLVRPCDGAPPAPVGRLRRQRISRAFRTVSLIFVEANADQNVSAISAPISL